MEILVESCPSYGEQLPDCPLASLRLDPDVAQRKERVAAMTDEEVERFIERHLSCVCRVCGTQKAIFPSWRP
jgi:rubredoxin